MMKLWKVTAEVDMDANRSETVVVKTNLLKKVRPLAEKAIKEKGHFYVGHMDIKLIRTEKEDTKNEE